MASKVRVVRDGKETTLEVKIAKRADDEEEVAAGEEDGEGPFELGIKGQDLTEELAERLGLEETRGVLITEVDPGSPADKAGLSRGDVIVELERKAIDNVGDLRSALESAKKDGPLLFLVKRGRNNLFVVVKPEKKDD